MIKSRKMRWTGHLAHMRMHTKFLEENLKGRDHFKALAIDGMIILEHILGKWSGKLQTGCIWLRVGTSGRFLYGNEPLGSIKSREFLKYLSDLAS
jgi:hypothetical protein